MRHQLPRWRERLGEYWLLVRGDRPIGVLLLLWPTLWGLWLAAEGLPPIGILAIFLAGVWLTRSAGCVINDYADRWLDPQVERTRQRPLASGSVSAPEALAVFAVLMLVAFALVLLTNRLTVYLALAGAALATTYPFLKRWTYLPQLWLGLAFGWAIPMGFAAVTGAVPPLAWLLFLANVLWSTAYDTWYAMVDRQDDLRAGAKSTAILLGEADLAGLAILQGGFVATLLLVGQRAELGKAWYAGVAVAAALAAWQLWYARDRSRERCFRAFLNNHWIGAAVFAGLAIDLAM
ncbi:MAG TPA: 4-hydroxybenzoate octaprenyltransferase [Xanthomonadaceae bacterium]|nr:4-hydroxybenzoate octaprenyltransferase [Xanthomonadaceae bacterium]